MSGLEALQKFKKKSWVRFTHARKIFKKCWVRFRGLEKFIFIN